MLFRAAFVANCFTVLFGPQPQTALFPSTLYGPIHRDVIATDALGELPEPGIQADLHPVPEPTAQGALVPATFPPELRHVRAEECIEFRAICSQSQATS